MNVYLDMVGCRLNQSELERFARRLRLAGHQIVGDAEIADIAIVNTCTVTVSAAADSRKMIRRIARAGCSKIYPTGCLATIDPSQVSKLPSVDKIFTNDQKETVVDGIPPANHVIDSENMNRLPLPGKHKRTRAFIKVQDGCDNLCTFCITRIARGKSRSQNKEEIFSDIQYALDGGVKEIVLTGVNLGSWGRDFEKPESLAMLVEEIMEKYSPRRIRLSSLEPWDVDNQILEMIRLPAFCRHLHLPLQSGSNRILKKMGRRITAEDYQLLVQRIRDMDESIAITTDLIVGFPGESEADFQENLEFIREMQFADGHVFRYSPRPGTPSEKMLFQVPEYVKKERSRQLRKVIDKASFEYRNSFVGVSLEVLWERSKQTPNGRFALSGISDNYLTITANSDKDLYNQIFCVKIISVNGDGISGEIVSA